MLKTHDSAGNATRRSISGAMTRLKRDALGRGPGRQQRGRVRRDVEVGKKRARRDAERATAEVDGRTSDGSPSLGARSAS